MKQLAKYYQQLNLPNNAPLVEVEKQYKRLIKRIHPSFNAKGKAQFISTHIAYSEILFHAYGICSISNNSVHPKYHTKEGVRQKLFEQQAEKYTRMSFSFYQKNSVYHVHVKSLLVRSALISTALYLTFLTIAIFFSLEMGLGGFAITLIIFSPFTFLIWAYGKSIHPKHLISGYSVLFKSKLFYQVLALVLTFLIVIKYVFYTDIHPLKLGIIIASVFYFIHIYLKKHPNPWVPNWFKIWGLCPLIVSLLFTLNYYISFNPQNNTYYLRQEYHKSSYRGRQTIAKTGFIHLENNQYKDEFWLRFFLTERYGNTITYTTYTGIFGFPVVKSYAFSWR